MVGKLLGRLGSRCRRVPGEEVEGPHIQAAKGRDVLGALNTDWGASLWQRNIFGEHKGPITS